MRVVVTGAAGFVAGAVVAALTADPGALGAPVDDLVLADTAAGAAAGRWMVGDLADPAHVAALLARPVDVLLHLASIPGQAAEQDPGPGRAVNLTASLALAEGLARQARSGGPRARMVFASSIAAMGPRGPGPVDETHPAATALSYGAHKRMVEIDLGDLTRRGEVDGVSLRLPGIVARPPGATGFGSAFMSEIFHRAAAGERYVLPVSSEATAWWMSRRVVAENILHAARIDADRVGASRVVLLPALHASVQAVRDGLATRLGPGAIAGLSHAPEARIEALFGRFAPIDNRAALALGFATDRDVADLVGNVLGAQA